MRLATLQKKRTDQNEVSRQDAGFGEQHARAPLMGSKVNSVSRFDSRLHRGARPFWSLRLASCQPGSFARRYLRLKYD
jgi:hypothetical protein